MYTTILLYLQISLFFLRSVIAVECLPFLVYRVKRKRKRKRLVSHLFFCILVGILYISLCTGIANSFFLPHLSSAISIVHQVDSFTHPPYPLSVQHTVYTVTTFSTTQTQYSFNQTFFPSPYLSSHARLATYLSVSKARGVAVVAKENGDFSGSTLRVCVHGRTVPRGP